MPPRWLRRLIAPLWVALAAAAAVASPLLALIAAVVSLLTGRRQPLLLVRFGLLYLLRESAVIVACGALWVLSGFGARLDDERFVRAHYRLLRWLLEGLIAPALRSLDIDVTAEPSSAAERVLQARDRPLLLLSRHAGPGDSVLVVYLLLARFARRPCLVMKRELALDPVVDLVCQRLPNALIDPSNSDACEAQIAALAGGLDGRSVLVIFPEGGNFTQERRVRAIDRLRRTGSRRRAAEAERLRHMLSPKPGGALAALQGHPDLDVVFAAHTGLGHETFPSELWRRLPTSRTLRMRMWLSPASERPVDRDGQVRWLDDWWRRLDDWIEAQGQE